MSELNSLQKLCTGEPEFVAGAIYGLRQWYVDDDGLYGHNSCRWHPGKDNTATCLFSRGHVNRPSGFWYGWLTPKYIEPHEVTDPRCSCGFYAYTNAEALLENSSSDPYQYIYGIIKAWGNVTVGTKGFRAQHAQIVGLTTREVVAATWTTFFFEKGDPYPRDLVELDRDIIPLTMPRYSDLSDLLSRYNSLVKEVG